METNVTRGGISVVTETGAETQSHLVIRNARQSDEGNYTCKPSIFRSASVRLFVIDGKICERIICLGHWSAVVYIKELERSYRFCSQSILLSIGKS